MLVQALRQIGIQKLNELQKFAIPKIAKGSNILITAPTGSGKTECAVIPILNKMLKMNCKGITFLYITPLRALNRDMIRRLRKLAGKLGFSIAIRHSDTPNSERRMQSLNPPQILITTPETFQILFLGKRLRESLKNVEFVVIDEIHELADSKRGVQLVLALERLKKLTKFQIIGLSATLSNAREVARYFGIENVIEWKGDKVYEFEVVYGDVDKIPEIVGKSTLIFTNTRQTSEALGLKLKDKLKVEVHHSSLSRDVRVEAERMFVNGELDALVCTSSMELGIDVGHVDVVIQFNSPREVRRLIQRVGRAGHKLGEVSRGYIVARDFDDILESWAIVKRAEDGKIEPVELYRMCLDVLANQIVAMLLEGYNPKEIYEIVKRTEPYRDIDYELFQSVLEFLERCGLIRDGRVTRIGRRYFYRNLSMIPDESKLKVVDITTNRVIGYLDESFISYFDFGVFAMKGELWRVLAIDDVVRVEPIKAEGVIPSWFGEEIPVPFEVAQEVGKLRGWIRDLLEVDCNCVKLKDIFNDEGACKVVFETLKDCVERGFEIPTDRVITIEGRGKLTINACFGHRVNETLAKAISPFLPRPFEISVDPYRIRIKANVDGNSIRDILMKIDVEKLREIVEVALLDSKILHYKFVEVAKRFGCIEDVKRVNVRSLILKLRETPVYLEALNEIFHNRLDLDRTCKVLRMIKNGEIEVLVYDELGPISRVNELKFDTFVDRDRSILHAFKERIENEECYMICVNCGCKVRMKVKMIERLECLRCGSRMVACVNARRGDVGIEELYRIANLVMCYGKRAIYALNTFGVGVNTAVRILSKFYRSEEEFLRELIEAEKRFIRTRIFWS
ncbi:MAG: helicase [Archaeoglobales archaeon]|nr:MAG: helicase [Archaeoglobales archaeon]